MKIEISDETAVSIIADVMVHDYRMLQADIIRYLEKPILSNVEQQDLDNWKKMIHSLDEVLEYYIGHDWKNRYYVQSLL